MLRVTLAFGVQLNAYTPPIANSVSGCQSCLLPNISALDELSLAFPRNYLDEAAGSHAVLHLGEWVCEMSPVTAMLWCTGTHEEA